MLYQQKFTTSSDALQLSEECSEILTDVLGNNNLAFYKASMHIRDEEEEEEEKGEEERINISAWVQKHWEQYVYLSKGLLLPCLGVVNLLRINKA